MPSQVLEKRANGRQPVSRVTQELSGKTHREVVILRILRILEFSMATKWQMEGTLLGACSCDWGCPCSFDAPPTRGFCEGTYAWHIERGRFGDVSLDGLSWAWVAKSPGPLHQGNVIGTTLTDERATAAQRAALETISEGKSGGPWTIFKAVSVQMLGPHYVPFRWGAGRARKQGERGGRSPDGTGTNPESRERRNRRNLFGQANRVHFQETDAGREQGLPGCRGFRF